MSKTITAYKHCEHCKHFVMLDKYYMHCKARDKKYMYGQSIPCEDMEKIDKKKEKEDE